MYTETLSGIESRRKFAVLVSAIQSRGKSLSEALKMAEMSFKRKQKKSETKLVLRDMAATTGYVFHHLIGSDLFFVDIDRAMDIAESFIEKFPTGTDWEKHELKNGRTWEDELYQHYLNWTKPA